MIEKAPVTTNTTNGRGKMITAWLLVAFVALVFVLTVLKFAKVW